MSKLDEVNIIMNLEINTNNYLEKLKKKYKNELNDFTYVNHINDIIILKDAFIRYISVKGQIGYGGFYYKVIKENNNFFILLINQNKKIWKVSFNDNFIFYKFIENNNDQKRMYFTDLLNKFNQN
jgi:hypothetical protein